MARWHQIVAAIILVACIACIGYFSYKYSQKNQVLKHVSRKTLSFVCMVSTTTHTSFYKTYLVSVSFLEPSPLARFLMILIMLKILSRLCYYSLRPKAEANSEKSFFAEKNLKPVEIFSVHRRYCRIMRIYISPYYPFVKGDTHRLLGLITY